MDLTRQMKEIKSQIRVKRKDLEAVQACKEDEERLFKTIDSSFNLSEMLREWDLSDVDEY